MKHLVKCEECNGKGVIDRIVKDYALNEERVIESCDECNGTGTVVEEDDEDDGIKMLNDLSDHIEKVTERMYLKNHP